MEIYGSGALFKCVSCNNFKNREEGQVVNVFLTVIDNEDWVGEQGIMSREVVCGSCAKEKTKLFIKLEERL